MSHIQKATFAALTSVALLTSASCAHHYERRPQELDRRIVNRTPSGDPYVNEEGECVRDFQVESEVDNRYRWETRGLDQDLVIGGLFIAYGVIGVLGAVDPANDPGAAFLVLSGLASFPVGLAFIGHGVYRKVTQPTDRTVTEPEKSTMTENATGCDGAPAIADDNSSETVGGSESPPDETAEDAVETAAKDDSGDSSEESSEENADVEARLKKLEGLREKGLITEEEYESKRREILDEI